MIAAPDVSLLETSTVDTLLAERSLFHFTKQAWPLIEQGREFLANWHHRVICAALERAARGKCKRLIINIPYRTTKSTLVSVMLPAWLWAHRSSAEFVTGSHASALAIRDAVKTRRVCESAWYKKRWPHVVFQSDQNVKTNYELTEGGRRLTFGMGSGVTGEGGDFLLIDDPHAAKDGMWSDNEREKVARAFDSELFSRLNDTKTSVIIIIMQRLHEDDLTGHVLHTSEEGEWEVIRLPMRFDARIASHHDERTVEGELLHEERFDADDVAKAERQLGPFGASGQLQQSPTIPGGGIFRDDDWRYYDKPPDRFDYVISSWDLTFGTEGGTSRTDGQTWGMIGPDTYLLDGLNARTDFTGELAMIKALNAKGLARGLKIIAALIENKADGPSAVNITRKSMAGVLPWPPKGQKIGSKKVRASAWSPRVASGNVYLPNPELNPWVRKFIAEHSAFDKGSHNDRVDTASQAHEWFMMKEASTARAAVDILTGGGNSSMWNP